MPSIAKIFLNLFSLVFLILVSVNPANAAPCAVGGAQTISGVAASCEINGSANYTDLTITGGAVITSSVGQKIDITATGTVTIDAGSGIDVSGKGNDAVRKGVNGFSTGSGCGGQWGSGGGGGGYGGNGGQGGADGGFTGGSGGGSGGSNTAPFDLGSPGGLGGWNASGSGMGGGVVKITAQNLVLNGYIKANGGNGSDPLGGDGTGGGGGGSGGSIWLVISNNFTTGGILEANGGRGGNDSPCGGTDGGGGGGGGGRIAAQYGTKSGAINNSEAGGSGGSGWPGVSGNPGTFSEAVLCDPNFGNPCTSAPNICGQTNSGTIDCAGNCTATAPPDSDCASCTISASPNPINIGSSSLLSWTAANSIAGGSSIDNGIGVVAIPTGTQSVSPAANTTYTMTVNGLSGTPGTCTATVSFTPPVCTLSANPIVVNSGDASTLSWTVTNATSATIIGFPPLTPAEIALGSGTKITPPIVANTSYSMTVDGPGGPGACGPIIVGFNAPPTSGLIPCGRIADNPATGDIIESNPCTLCAMFYLLKNVINFVMTLAIGVGVFILVIAGLLYALSAGDTRRIELAKSAVTSALIGIAIVFVAWLAIAVILQGMGYASMSTWNQVNCVP